MFQVVLHASDIYLNLSASGTKETRRQFVFLKDFENLHKLDPANDIFDRAKKVYAIVLSDLKVENGFKIEDSLSVKKIISENQMNYDEWIMQNIDYRIEGKFENKTGALHIQLFYVPNKEKIFEKKYILLADNIKPTAHKISDEIYFAITGYKGLHSTKIVFSYILNASKTNVKELYTVDYDGNDLKQITNNRSISILPAWNPKKRQLLYTCYKFMNPDLFLYDFVVGKTSIVSDKQGLNMGVQYSPDGAKIAMSRTINGNLEIVIIDNQGVELKRITQNKCIDFSPTWSEDAKKLAFMSDKTGSTQIYIYDLEADESYPLTFENQDKDSLDWSPVNDELVFSSQNNKWDIYKLDINTNQITKLTENTGNNEEPSWSPDGQYICFTSTRNGNKELFIMKKDGTNQRRVFTASGQVYSPKWSPLYE